MFTRTLVLPSFYYPSELHVFTTAADFSRLVHTFQSESLSCWYWASCDGDRCVKVNYVIQCCRLIFPSASSSPPPSICLIALNPECVFCAVSSICRAVRVGDGRGCKSVCAAVLHHALLLPALRMTLYWLYCVYVCVCVLRLEGSAGWWMSAVGNLFSQHTHQQYGGLRYLHQHHVTSALLMHI